jgi:superoxide dismutase
VVNFNNLTGLLRISEEQLAQRQQQYLHYLNQSDQGTVFDRNQVTLYQLYFANLRPQGGELISSSVLFAKIVQCFGAYATWEQEFKSLKGGAWGMLCQDPVTEYLTNICVSSEDALPAIPILVMDLSDEVGYQEAFLQNINWSACRARLQLQALKEIPDIQ